jgi:hypothetical protein
VRVAAAAAVVSVLVVAGGAQAATGPAATLLREVALTRAGSYPALYRLYTPRFRAACPYRRFVTAMKHQRAQLAGITFRVIGQHVSGTHGTVDYHVLLGTAVVDTIRGDRYTKIGGRWLDEADRYTLCS